MENPVLFVGGSGSVGRAAVRWFRERHPAAPLLIGGRNLRAASEVAREAGAAEAVAIDLDEPRLGLGDDLAVAAVVMLAPEVGLNGLRYAQDLGVPYLSIGNAAADVGPEMAQFAHRATAAPVVLASHWLGGPAVFMALSTAKGFDTVQSIRIGSLLDEEDAAGPAAVEDIKRLLEAVPAALAFEGGRRVWLTGDRGKGTVETIDGRSLDADAFSCLDILSLPVATGASDVRFDWVTDVSSSRRQGGRPAVEIVVEVRGEVDGRPKRSRSTLEFKPGSGSLTGLCAVLALTAVLGLDDGDPSPSGLYLPELLADAEWFLGGLNDAGATIQQDGE